MPSKSKSATATVTSNTSTKKNHSSKHQHNERPEKNVINTPASTSAVKIPPIQRGKSGKGSKNDIEKSNIVQPLTVTKAVQRSISSRCNLILPVNRFTEKMKDLMKNYRYAGTAPIYLTGAIEQLITLLLTEVAKVVVDHHKSRITPALILSTIQQNDQLTTLFLNTVFFGVGYSDGGYDTKFCEDREEAKKKKKSRKINKKGKKTNDVKK